MENHRIIDDLETCGWFADLPADRASSLWKKLSGQDGEKSHLHLASVVIEDPDSFGDAGSLMVAESESEITSYEDLLKAYANASEGAFNPEAIVEEVSDEERQFAIGFLEQGRIYALFIPGAPRFDLEINDLVNESLANTGAQKRFFVLPTPDQTVAIAFISPAVFERACQLEIIPLQEELLPELYGDALGIAEPARSTITARTREMRPVTATA